ncbi:hypothetical protein SARC_01190 [Sphaeroforma arctica JP610]|uniref:Uncharacterized protein n=1 Tax=Sphaeroforma arctica JP610 TaxID=667725 RepID=A0A0L0GEI6_9EUKA|nr:hypothetical protein SARC_01190 [Sphaeroforma arctica JP610]KNC86653.1 hypothetical protein SARC_01190 [Sphaeroforma arctica JP610]|eukprot:XP_014160555.1 hypothetical protein SARC_01190 [Sphaeroforma arctica JP610]
MQKKVVTTKRPDIEQPCSPEVSKSRSPEIPWFRGSEVLKFQMFRGSEVPNRRGPRRRKPEAQTRRLLTPSGPRGADARPHLAHQSNS